MFSVSFIPRKQSESLDGLFVNEKKNKNSVEKKLYTYIFLII